MPHNISGVNAFTDPVPAYSDGDAVAQVSNDPTIQALANRDVNLTTRLGVIEGQSLNSRLSTLEGYNLNSRLSTLEGYVPLTPIAYAAVILTSGTPTLGLSAGVSSVGISGGAIQVNLSASISGTFGVVALPDIGITACAMFYQITTAAQFIVGATALAGGSVNFGAATGNVSIIVMGR